MKTKVRPTSSLHQCLQRTAPLWSLCLKQELNTEPTVEIECHSVSWTCAASSVNKLHLVYMNNIEIKLFHYLLISGVASNIKVFVVPILRWQIYFVRSFFLTDVLMTFLAFVYTCLGIHVAAWQGLKIHVKLKKVITLQGLNFLQKNNVITCKKRR